MRMCSLPLCVSESMPMCVVCVRVVCGNGSITLLKRRGAGESGLCCFVYTLSCNMAQVITLLGPGLA